MNRFKAKGERFEREIVQLAQSMGLTAHRIPLSGSTWIKGDVLIEGRKLECKKRASGFKQIRDWIQGFDGLIIGSDHEKPLVVVRLEEWLKLLLKVKDIQVKI